jgi:putative transposase
MTNRKGKSGTIDVKASLARDEEFLRVLMQTVLEEVLEAEMTEALGAEKAERTPGRMATGWAITVERCTCVGKLELRVQQD